jgi:hypothetical protein
MIISRSWAMPSKNTFAIKPIEQLIVKYLHGVSIDPFANQSKLATWTNDIDCSYKTTHNMDAAEFIRTFADGSIDVVLFDPPYSPRQVSECYKALNLSVNMETTQASFWAKCKKQIARVTAAGGYCITCGWNSGGIGKKHGFKIVEILLVAHGGWHNDTIVTVEQKQKTLFD